MIASLVFNPVMRDSERTLIQQALKRSAAELSARVRADTSTRVDGHADGASGIAGPRDNP